MELCYLERRTRGFSWCEFEEGEEVNEAVSEEQRDEVETMTFGEGSSLEVVEVVPPKL